MIAPFGNVSILPWTNFCIRANPIHNTTKSPWYVPFSVTTSVTLPFSPLNFWTFSPSTNFTPLSVNSFSATSVKSLSRYLAIILFSASINVTFFPCISNASTSSTPIYPAPIITTFLASFDFSIIFNAWSWFLHKTMFSNSPPSNFGTIGHDPKVNTNLS